MAVPSKVRIGFSRGWLNLAQQFPKNLSKIQVFAIKLGALPCPIFLDVAGRLQWDLSIILLLKR